jgi:hypothetical protein
MNRNASPLDSQWFLEPGSESRLGGKPLGPYTFDQLRALREKGIDETLRVTCESLQGEFVVLGDLLRRVPPVAAAEDDPTTDLLAALRVVRERKAQNAAPDPAFNPIPPPPPKVRKPRKKLPVRLLAIGVGSSLLFLFLVAGLLSWLNRPRPPQSTPSAVAVPPPAAVAPVVIEKPPAVRPLPPVPPPAFRRDSIPVHREEPRPQPPEPERREDDVPRETREQLQDAGYVEVPTQRDAEAPLSLPGPGNPGTPENGDGPVRPDGAEAPPEGLTPSPETD